MKTAQINKCGDPTLRPADRLAGLSPYRRACSPNSIRLALDANEGPAPGAGILESLGSVRAESVQRYPDARALETEIARCWGVEAAQVVVTNGGDEAIDRVCRALLQPGRRLVSHAPSFEMISRSAILAGARVIELPWIDGPFPTDAIINHIKPCSVVSLVSPNNPTGCEIPIEDVEAIAAQAIRLRSVVLLDLAYIEFSESDPMQRVLARSNVVVIRTLSKAYGLAGLRVGYAVSSAQIAEWLRTVGGPFPVSGVSLEVARAAVAGGVDFAAMDRIRAERARLTACLSAGGARVLDSQANFVAAFVTDGVAFGLSLLERGVAVRTFGSRDPIRNLVRITLPGNDKDFKVLLAAITDTLREQGAEQ